MKKNKLFMAIIGLFAIGQVAFAQPGSTFANPFVVPSTLPYFGIGETTCGFGDSLTATSISCAGNFLSGDEKIYSFTPAKTSSLYQVAIRNISDNFSGLFITDDVAGLGVCMASLGNPSSNDREVSGLTMTAGTTYYIVVSSWANPQCISSYDIEILEMSCPAPNSLDTANVTTTTVDLSWVETGSATSWVVEYGPPGFMPGTGIMTPASSNPFTLTGLSPSSFYDFYVQANCGVDSSYSVGPFGFATLCGAVIAPVTESFDLSGTPFCFSQTATSGGPWQTNGTPGYGASGAQDHTGNGGNFIWMDQSGTNVAVSLATYDVDVTALTVPFLEFFYYTNNTTSTAINDLIVESWSGTSWVKIDSIHANLGGWTKFGYNLTGHTYGTNLVKVRFRAESGGASNDYHQDQLLDDISFIEIPSCPDPTSLAAAAIGSSADLSWIEPGSATQWEIEYGFAGFVPGTGATVFASTNPYTLSPLLGTTNYEYYIRSVCGANDSSDWVGPFAFTTTASCPQPSALTAAVTLTSVDFDWVEIGSATLWEYEYGVSGFALGTGSSDTTTTHPVTVAGLNYATDYDVYVKSICSASDSSIWVGPISFTTPCPIYTPRYTESFTSFTPNCWEQATNGTIATGPTGIGSSSWYYSSNLGNSVRMNLYSNSKSDWALSPEFDLSAGGYQLKLDVAVTNWNSTTPDAMGSDDSVQVAYTEDGITWTVIKSWTAADNLVNSLSTNVIALTSTATSVRFGIRGTEGTVDDPEDYDFHFSNFVVELVPTCAGVTSLTADTILRNSAVLGWTESASATTWNIEWGPVGFSPGSGTVILNVSANPYTLTGLTALTSYDFYVRSVCAAFDTSSWTGPFGFTTACPIYTPRYSESFATFTPTCWEQATDGDIASGPTGVGSSSWYYSSNLGNSVRMNLYSNSKSDWALSPEFDLSAGSYQLKMDVAVTTWLGSSPAAMGSDDSVQVAYTEDGITWTVIKSWTAADSLSNSLAASTMILSSTGSSVQFGIRGTEGSIDDSEDYDFHFTDFVIETIPQCVEPNGLSVSNIAATSADLSWTEQGSATQWEVEYDTIGFTQGTGMDSITVNNPLTVTGLSPHSGYEFYVRAICGVGDTSAWEGPKSFNTLFTPPAGVVCGGTSSSFIYTDLMEANTGWSGDIGSSNGQWDFPTNGGNSSGTGPSGPFIGSGYAEYEASGNSSAIASLVTPMIDLSGVTTDAELSFYMHAFGGDIGTLNVGIGSSISGPFTNVYTWTGEYQTSESEPWANIGVNIAAYVGQQIFVEFSYGGTGNGYEGDMAIDYVRVEGCVSCPAPIDLMDTNVTANSAELKWTEIGSATQWEVEYDLTNFTLGSGTAAFTNFDSIVVGSLLSNSTYDYYVRAICGPGDTSAWSGPYVFVTPCASMIAPYIDSVETHVTTTSSDISNCWSSTPSSTTSSFRWNVSSAGTPSPSTGPDVAYSGSKYFYTEGSNGSNGSVAELYTPNVDVTALTSPMVQFQYHMYGSDMGTLYVDVFDGSTWTTEDSIVGQHQTANTDAWIRKSVYLDNYTGIIQVRLRAVRGNGFTNDMSIDDFEVKEGPTCKDPQQVTVDSVDVNSAYISWIDLNGASTWNYEYGVAGFPQGSGTTVVSSTANTTISSLLPNTLYDFYVQTECSTSDSSEWVGPIQFRTDCGVYNTFPFVENFDILSPTINCWFNDYVVGQGNWSLGIGSSGGSITTSQASGYNLVFVSTSGSNSPVTKVVSPLFDVNALISPRISFWYGQEEWFGDQNTLAVYYRLSPSNPWVPMWADSSEVDVWTEVVLSIPVKSDSIQFAFEGTNNYGYANVVDEFMVTDVDANELAVVSVEAFGGDCGLTNDSVRATVVNYGSQAQTSFDMGFSVNGVAITPETVTANIGVLDTVVYTFTVEAVYTTQGISELLTYVILPGDTVSGNDTVMTEVTKWPVITMFPYNESFASGKNGWTIDNQTNGTWEFGLPSKVVIDTSASDTNSFVVGGLSSDYESDEDGFVYSPCFDFTNIDQPQVQLSVWWESEEGWDGANVQYSTDGGTTWSIVGSSNTGESWYTRSSVNGLGAAGWSGSGTSGSGKWVVASHGVDFLGGTPLVNFRVAFGSDGSFQDEGFAFDDFSVFDGPDLGADTVLCTDQTLTLTPGSFDGYYWTDSTISSLLFVDANNYDEGTHNIEVVVAGQGGYKMYDMVVITVEKPVINLGADSTLCFGESVTLDADTGFVSYMWNDNSTMQTLVTDGSTAGSTNYYVEGVTALGCPAVDSVDITVNTQVLVDLGIDTTFYDSTFQATSYTLDAGPGFASYTWSTGETTRTIVVDSLNDGDISVVVTNVIGCEGSDTVTVNFVLGVNSSFAVSTLKMYPNPATDQITIDVTNFNGLDVINVTIVDITGKIVLIEKLEGTGSKFNETYDVSTFATGTYFVQFEANGEVVTRQFIIK